MAAAENDLLRTIATEQLARGDLESAVQSFVELERREGLPAWARWAGTAYHRLGRHDEAVAAFNRASAAYVARGEILKAVAACKQVLQLDPGNREATSRLSSVGAEPSRPEAPAPMSLLPPITPASFLDDPSATLEAGGPREPVDPPGLAPVPSLPLDSLRLADVIPGAAPVSGSSAAAVYHIPLPDDADEGLSVDLPSAGTGTEPEDTLDDSVQVDRAGNVVGGAPRPSRAPSAGPSGPVDRAVSALEEEMRIAERASAALTRTPFFDALGPMSFGRMFMAAKLVELRRGQTLFRQGDPGDALYVIAHGAVEVVDEGPPRRVVDHMRDGEFFGEVALVTDQPRNATITAIEDTELISVGRDVIQRVAAEDKAFIPSMLRFLRDRLMNRLFGSNPLFSGLTPAEREQIKHRFRFLEIGPGAVLIEQGKTPSGLMVLLAGAAEAVRHHEGRALRLGTLGAGDILGEIALVGQAFPRQSLAVRLRPKELAGIDLATSIGTVTTTTKCFALELPAKDFMKVVRSEGLAFIRGVILRRAAQVRSILAGESPYAEGRVRL